jgi:hypothetical protein
MCFKMILIRGVCVSKWSLSVCVSKWSSSGVTKWSGSRQEVWWSVEHVQAHYRRVFGTIAAHFPRGVGPQQLHPEHNSNTDPRLLGPENPEKELSLASPWRAPNSRSSCHATVTFLVLILGPQIWSLQCLLQSLVFGDKLAGFFGTKTMFERVWRTGSMARYDRSKGCANA